MGNNQVICGKFVGEKLPGQTKIMRNANMADDAELIKDFKGMGSLKDIFEYYFLLNLMCIGTMRKQTLPNCS